MCLVYGLCKMTKLKEKSDGMEDDDSELWEVDDEDEIS